MELPIASRGARVLPGWMRLSRFRDAAFEHTPVSARPSDLTTFRPADLTALRYNDWKALFMEQKAESTLRAWIEPWTPLRVPLIFHLRRDPYERAYSTSNTYYDWLIDRVFFLVPAQDYVEVILS